MIEAARKSAQWLRLAVTFVWSQAGNIEKQLWELTGPYIKGVNFLSPLSLLLAYAFLYSIWRANAAFMGLSAGGDVIFLERRHPLGSMCQDISLHVCANATCGPAWSHQSAEGPPSTSTRQAVILWAAGCLPSVVLCGPQSCYAPVSVTRLKAPFRVTFVVSPSLAPNGCPIDISELSCI